MDQNALTVAAQRTQTSGRLLSTLHSVQAIWYKLRPIHTTKTTLWLATKLEERRWEPKRRLESSPSQTGDSQARGECMAARFHFVFHFASKCLCFPCFCVLCIFDMFHAAQCSHFSGTPAGHHQGHGGATAAARGHGV